MRLGKQFSTTKVRSRVVESTYLILLLDESNNCLQDVLEKLRPLHPLPGLILEWRRITNALTKVVFPLQREKKHHSALSMDRIYPIAQTHTATGNPQTPTPLCSTGCNKCAKCSDSVSFSHQVESALLNLTYRMSPKTLRFTWLRWCARAHLLKTAATRPPRKGKSAPESMDGGLIIETKLGLHRHDHECMFRGQF